ncbi:MAG: N-acetylmuramoyl-L-alanine amidase [Rikenellaceae bacterium]
MKTKLFFNIVTILTILFASIPIQTTLAQGVKVVVIDPGHGGIFPGARYGGHAEKDINLRVALKLGEILRKGHPEVKVVFTRTKDVDLAKNLKEDLSMRTKIANDANGDLFISIHANAATNTSASGAETIIMGESSLEKQRNDAALYTANQEYLIDMSDEKTAAIVRAYIQNTQFTYGQYSEAFARLIHKNYEKKGHKVRTVRRQPIMVLYDSNMPCALTEIGFMSNAKDLAYMTSTKGVQEIAEAIYGGIHDYIEMVNRTKISTSKSSPEIKDGRYTIQILSSKKELSPNDPQFKSYRGKTWCKSSNNSKYQYQYCVGKYKTKNEATEILQEIRKSFKDAFLTTY